MTAPDAIILRERVREGPMRRVVYHPLETGDWERKEQMWRLAIEGWHTRGTEIVETLRIDAPEGER